MTTWCHSRGRLELLGQAFLDFPIKFVLDFMKHHRMLAIRGRPKWRTVEGGSRTYVRALMQHLPAGAL